MQYEVLEYSQEGIDFFRASLENQERILNLTFYEAFDGDKLVGTIYMRAPQHIGGFFVDTAYHSWDIGRQLFEAMHRDNACQMFNVNFLPYAVEVYCHLGFIITDMEQIVNGMRFTPMGYQAYMFLVVSLLQVKAGRQFITRKVNGHLRKGKSYSGSAARNEDERGHQEDKG